MANPHITQVTAELVHRWRMGDADAMNGLLEHACGRLGALVSRQLRSNPRLHRWEQTTDVMQNVLLRLCRALRQVQVRDVRSFYALASRQIRREIIDLWRHHYGKLGPGRHHASVSDLEAGVEGAAEGTAGDRARLIELHELVERMPHDLREVVDLLWYQGLSQEEAAALLNVSVRTLSRQWRQARLMLGKALGEGGRTGELGHGGG